MRYQVHSVHRVDMTDISNIPLNPIVVILGNYGSGKTEVALNYALTCADAGQTVKIADLDIVNPYFRTREARDILRTAGIEVILPDSQYLYADLPIVVPQIRGIIRQPGQRAILDVGGDDAGATVLSSLADVFGNVAHDVLLIVNESRPFTDTVDGCLKIAHEIEGASRLKVTGVVGNTHLLTQTTLDTIHRGYDFTCKVATELGVPLQFITAERRFIDDIDAKRIDCPILLIERLLLPPWQPKTKLGSANFRLS